MKRRERQKTLLLNGSNLMAVDLNMHQNLADPDESKTSNASVETRFPLC